MYDLMQAGLKAFDAFNSASINKQMTAISNRVNVANADAANVTRRGQNALSAAVSSNNRFVQSVNNNRQLAAAGSAVEATFVNSLRQQDELLSQGFEASISAAEQLGMSAAASAAAGAGSSATDAVNVATALRSARVQQSLDDSLETFQYDTSRRAMSIASQAVDGLDVSNQFTNLDYATNVAQTKRAPSPWSAAISSVVSDFTGGSLKGLAKDVGTIYDDLTRGDPAGNGLKLKAAGTGFAPESTGAPAAAADPFSSSLNFDMGKLLL